MMGDLKKRASFAKLVNYVNNPKKSKTHRQQGRAA